MCYDKHDYTSIARRLDTPRLKSVRDVHDACFAYKIANYDLPCPEVTTHIIQRNVVYNIHLSGIPSKLFASLSYTPTYQALEFIVHLHSKC